MTGTMQVMATSVPLVEVSSGLVAYYDPSQAASYSVTGYDL